MGEHHFIFIGMLLVLLLFKRSRYASFVYLVPYVIYFYLYLKGLIPDNFYHSISATFNTFIGILLFKGYEYTGFNNIFNLHKYKVNQKVGLLSFLLVFINLVGYWKYEHGFGATIYNSDYRFIVAVQISLLYIGNMINAWVDRRNNQRSMVRLTDIDYFETSGEIHQKQKGE